MFKSVLRGRSVSVQGTGTSCKANIPNERRRSKLETSLERIESRIVNKLPSIVKLSRKKKSVADEQVKEEVSEDNNNNCENQLPNESSWASKSNKNNHEIFNEDCMAHGTSYNEHFSYTIYDVLNETKNQSQEIISNENANKNTNSLTLVEFLNDKSHSFLPIEHDKARPPPYITESFSPNTDAAMITENNANIDDTVAGSLDLQKFSTDVTSLEKEKSEPMNTISIVETSKGSISLYSFDNRKHGSTTKAESGEADYREILHFSHHPALLTGKQAEKEFENFIRQQQAFCPTMQMVFDRNINIECKHSNEVERKPVHLMNLIKSVSDLSEITYNRLHQTDKNVAKNEGKTEVTNDCKYLTAEFEPTKDSIIINEETNIYNNTLEASDTRTLCELSFQSSSHFTSKYEPPDLRSLELDCGANSSPFCSNKESEKKSVQQISNVKKNENRSDKGHKQTERAECKSRRSRKSEHKRKDERIACHKFNNLNFREGSHLENQAEIAEGVHSRCSFDELLIDNKADPQQTYCEENTNNEVADSTNACGLCGCSKCKGKRNKHKHKMKSELKKSRMKSAATHVSYVQIKTGSQVPFDIMKSQERCKQDISFDMDNKTYMKWIENHYGIRKARKHQNIVLCQRISSLCEPKNADNAKDKTQDAQGRRNFREHKEENIYFNEEYENNQISNPLFKSLLFAYNKMSQDPYTTPFDPVFPFRKMERQLADESGVALDKPEIEKKLPSKKRVRRHRPNFIASSAINRTKEQERIEKENKVQTNVVRVDTACPVCSASYASEK